LTVKFGDEKIATREIRVLTLPSPFTIFNVPLVSVLSIRQVAAKVFVELAQRELAPFKFLPGAMSTTSNTTISRGLKLEY
jgi:hypothetical protein